MTRATWCLAIVWLGGGAQALPAQSAFRATPMAQAVGVATRAGPVPGGPDRTELRLTQPVLMLQAEGWDRIRGVVTLNLESVTLRGGELTPGAWGEGFVDRRHPHTTVHELMLAATDLLGRHDGTGSLGLAAGKGFVPFGTDDPMVRPFVRYPVNHHLAQILERAVVIVQYARGPVVLEGALFNGDEPERPGQWPLLRNDEGWRFGDSRAVRLEVTPTAGITLQGSLARVHSPEHRQGAGGDADKASLSARHVDGSLAGRREVLVEWARTSELGGAFVFGSLLAEAMVHRGRIGIGYRFERSERPEEERLQDPFRSRRPHLENSILGITRWTTHTLRAEVDLRDPFDRAQLTPFVETTFGSVRTVGGGLFAVGDLYNTSRVAQLTLGVTLGWGMRGHRMGRYGVHAGH